MKYTTILAALLIAASACAQRTVNVKLSQNTTSAKRVDLKAYTEQNILVDVVDFDETGVTATLGIKTSKTATQFFAFTNTTGTATGFAFNLPASMLSTNISTDLTLYGDIRIDNYDNTLPSLDVRLKPSFNWGSETYAAPSNWELRTNGTSAGSIRIIDFTDNLDLAVVGDKLTVGISGAGTGDFLADGTIPMTGDFNAGGQNITNTPLVHISGGTGTQGQLSWNTDEETLDLICDGAVLQIGQELYYHVRNTTGTTITNGTLVYASGTVGASGRILVTPYLADGAIAVMFVLGIATEDIPTGADGKITEFGKVRGLDTSMYSEGAVLYASETTAGGYTTNAPAIPNVSLAVAFVITSHANNGVLAVRINNLDVNEFATAAQGALADSATQPADLAPYIQTGDDASLGTITTTNTAGTSTFAGPVQFKTAPSSFPIDTPYMGLGPEGYAALYFVAGGVTQSVYRARTVKCEGDFVIAWNAKALRDDNGTLWTSEGTATNGEEIVNYDTAVAMIVDTFQGPRQDLGTTNTIVWLPTKYSGKVTTTGAATFAMDTDTTYPRATYSLWQYGAHAITFDSQIDVQNTITPTGTNLWVIGIGDTTTNWVAVGRAF